MQLSKVVCFFLGLSTGRVYKVELGKLPDLEFMSLRGIQWRWSAISSILYCASEVRHLIMKIEFCGDFDTLQPFPEIDLVDFFNNHPRLCKFEIHGALFAAFCQKNSLKNVSCKQHNSIFLSKSKQSVTIAYDSW